jgi:hypothetical protein
MINALNIKKHGEEQTNNPQLKFPPVMKLDSGSIMPSEKTFLFYLRRRAFSGRLLHQEIFFKREYTTASRTFKAVTYFIRPKASKIDLLMT